MNDQDKKVKVRGEGEQRKFTATVLRGRDAPAPHLCTNDELRMTNDELRKLTSTVHLGPSPSPIHKVKVRGEGEQRNFKL